MLDMDGKFKTASLNKFNETLHHALHTIFNQFQFWTNLDLDT